MLENVRSFFLNVIDRFVPSEVIEQEDFISILQFRLVAGLNVIAIVLLPPLFYVEASAVGFSSLLVSVNLVLYFSLLLSLYFLSFKKSKYSAILVWIVGCLVGIFGTAWGGQGLFDANLMWLIIGPLAGIVFAGIKLGGICYILSIFGLVLLLVMNPVGMADLGISKADVDYRFFSILVPLTCSALFGLFIRYIITYTEKQLLQMREKFLSLKVKQFEDQKLVSLGSFSGGIAHEINNPLAIAMGKLNQLERYIEKPGHEKERILKHTSILNKQLSRIAKIVGGLRNITKEKSSRENIEQFELNSLVQESLVLFKGRLFSEKIKLIVELTDDDSSVLGPKALFSQAFINVFENAVDAVEMSSEKIIGVKTYLKSGRVVVSVTDSGSGIPMDVKERIWEPFFSTKDVDKGTGLGLSIALSILQKHGGGLSLGDKVGGSEFVLDFPPGESSKRTLEEISERTTEEESAA